MWLVMSSEKKLLDVIRRKQIDTPIADSYGGFPEPPIGFTVCYAIVWADRRIRYYRTLGAAQKQLKNPLLREKAESLIKYRFVEIYRGGKRKRQRHWQSEWKPEYFYEQSEW